MSDMYLIDFSGGDEAKQWRAELEAKRERNYRRYLEHLMNAASLDRLTATRVMDCLFRHNHTDGSDCPCGCHPRLNDGDLHDSGFDCSCTWDEKKRKERSAKWLANLDAYWDSPEGRAISEQNKNEERAIKEWIAAQPGLEAERTTFACPEQWKGTVDGHSFYFRERHGTWRIEVDLEPTGDFANRVVDVDDSGEFATEPVPITAGEVIAEGVEGELGKTAIDHIDFIVRKIRDYVWGLSCDHLGALFFCPKCGERMSTLQ
ncbi:MAG: hypothetical protein ACR2FO_00265 [Actinomycetota bacterium]